MSTCKGFFDAVRCRAELASVNDKVKQLEKSGADCQNKLGLCENTLRVCKSENISFAEALSEALGESSALRDKVDTLTQTNDTLIAENDLLVAQKSELDEVVRLMEDGPGDPQDPLRVLTLDLMIQKLGITYSDVFHGCHTRMFADSDWLIASRRDVQFYLDYYSMFWLPKIKPYTILEFTKLDGTVVRLMIRNCDEFCDFFQGFPALHLPWSGLPWGIFWGEVQGWISGYHAFNWTMYYTDGYDENGIAGIETSIIEPQGKNSMWVPTRDGEVKVTVADRLVAQPAAMFTVNSLGAIKV